MALEGLSYQAARQVIGLLAGNGLLDEAVHFAAKALSAGWRRDTIERFSKTGPGELNHRLNLLVRNWWAFRDDEAQKTNPSWGALVRLVCRAPGLAENPYLTVVGAGLVPRSASAGTLLNLSRDLLNRGESQSAASVLVTAVRPEFATVDVLESANEVAAALPDRKLGPLDPNLARQLSKDSTLMALLGEHNLAFQTELIAKSAEVGPEEFRLLAQRMLNRAPSHEASAMDSERLRTELTLGSELWRRGYWANAAEMLDLLVQVPTQSNDYWKDAWSLLEPDTSVARKVAAGASLVQDVVAPLIVSLPSIVTYSKTRPTAPSSSSEPDAPAFPSEAPETISLLEDASPEKPIESNATRHVNVQVQRLRDVERGYRVLANIGPPKPGSAGGLFHEPNWEGRDYMDLRLTLDGDADITPAWRDLRLPKTGSTPDVDFRVIPFGDGPLSLDLRVYTAKEFILLERYSLQFEVTGRRVPA